MKPYIIAALVAAAVVLIAIAGSRRITRTRARWEADIARRAEVEHQDADEDWAEELHHIAEVNARYPGRLEPVELEKPPPPPWYARPADPAESTPACPGEPPHLEVDLSFTRAWQRADIDAMLQRADADMLDALRRPR